MTFVIKTHFQNFHLDSEKLTAKLNNLDHDTGGRGQQNDEADHQPPLQEQGGLPQRAHLQRFQCSGQDSSPVTQHIWESDAESFSVVEDPREPTLKRGTQISLYPKGEFIDLRSHGGEDCAHPLMKLSFSRSSVTRDSTTCTARARA